MKFFFFFLNCFLLFRINLRFCLLVDIEQSIVLYEWETVLICRYRIVYYFAIINLLSTYSSLLKGNNRKKLFIKFNPTILRHPWLFTKRYDRRQVCLSLKLSTSVCQLTRDHGA